MCLYLTVDGININTLKTILIAWTVLFDANKIFYKNNCAYWRVNIIDTGCHWNIPMCTLASCFSLFIIKLEYLVADLQLLFDQPVWNSSVWRDCQNSNAISYADMLEICELFMNGTASICEYRANTNEWDNYHTKKVFCDACKPC